jgi:HSP20 family molecular chaperone IbpA
MLPRVFGENLFDDWFDFPDFRNFERDMQRNMRDLDRKLYGRHASREMKTDVHEHDDHYEMRIDLPGFKKEQITLTLENGYLTVAAEKGVETENNGKLIRQERYSGEMARSFYVGEDITEDEIKAKYEHGVLSLEIPKKEAKPKLPEKKTILIEG